MYTVNHIHLKAPDPMETAQWYVDAFGAEITGQAEGLGGAKTVRIDLGGTRFNISSAPEGESLPDGTADLHYGLEHFGLHTDDIEQSISPVPWYRGASAHHAGRVREQDRLCQRP